MNGNNIPQSSTTIEMNENNVETITSDSSEGTYSQSTGVENSSRQRTSMRNSEAVHQVPKTIGGKSICEKGQKNYDRSVKSLKSRTALDWLGTFLPIFKWLPSYNWKTDLPLDLVAGLTVGVMVIPQSMSYAKLAGLPVEYGLYSALVPVLIYAIFGSSRQLAVGPVAILSLTLSTELSHLPEFSSSSTLTPEEQQSLYNNLAIQAAFLVGLFYIVMGIMRLGFITIFLSHAVTSGFTTGAAVIIGFSQLKYILGYDIERSDRLHEMLKNTFAHIDQFNYKTFLMGSSCVLILWVMKKIGKTYPKFKFLRAIGPLTVTVITILITWAADLDQKGIAIVEYIPQGLPPLTISSWFPVDTRLIKTVVSLVIVGFMESIAIAKQLASIHKYPLDSSLELIGLGMSNMMGAMFQAYPVTGSFSRSAVNNETGAVSGISGLFTAFLVAMILLFLTPVFELMPLSVLASIVISGVIGLIDTPEAKYLWRVNKFDFFVWVVSCLGTMFLGVEIGLAIAVITSLLLVIYESAYPHTATLGQLPQTNIYRNIKQYPSATLFDGLVICRIDAPVYFANAQYIFQEKLIKYEAQAAQTSALPIKFMIIDLTPVSHIDTTAMHIIHDCISSYRSRGIQVCFCNPTKRVMETLQLGGLLDKLGEENVFVRTHDAVVFCQSQMEKGGEKV